MEIRKLEEMFEVLRSKPKKRLVAAYANDDHTICAVNAAVKEGLIEATLLGDENVIAEVCKAENIDMNNFRIINEPVDVKAAAMACDIINRGEADILMKGLLPTDKYMRAILNKERGLCPPNVTLAHVAVIENPNYHKLMVVSDCAIIPLPDIKQKTAYEMSARDWSSDVCSSDLQQGTRPLPAQRHPGPCRRHRKPQLPQTHGGIRLRHHPAARHQAETTTA